MADTPESSVGWASVAHETFEFNLVPWAGRKYAPWMRAWARPHPGDPRGLIQVPEDVYRAFQLRTPGQRLTRATVEGLGYPSVPGETELERVRKELHDALRRGDWDHAHDLDAQLRELEERVAALRGTALGVRPAGA